MEDDLRYRLNEAVNKLVDSIENVESLANQARMKLDSLKKEHDFSIKEMEKKFEQLLDDIRRKSS